MDSRAILRIQDRTGRGPWRPGCASKWVDAWRTSQLPPIYDDVHDFRKIVSGAHGAGLHIGCAVRGMDGLGKWFSPMELSRLITQGFGVVDASGCDVLAETEHQLLIASKWPLSRLPMAQVAIA
ncbi:hypothetical protein CN97_00820 [Haematobacter massiliensis]|uniref:Uncharacterized protein n=1 Tax=Haematobacter massiliensis TaxID=195105 RepID=A0A086Y0I9_9RHOB|nr:hypothetical protein CN97_00820 [Haematobacter massiliensis]OWJ82725.1 hypothetical protein CDV51_17100 [Haematobacter massiliensis]